MLRNTQRSFGALTKLFHWLLATFIIAQYYLIWGQDFFPKHSPERVQYILLHKSLGVSILALGLLFLLWRIVNIKPETPVFQPPWKRITATMVHHSLLTLLIIMPILGYLMSSADGRTVNVFGWFNLPNLISPNENLANIFFQAHQKIGYLFLGLIVLHVLAALHHHFIVRDNVLRRMMPFCK